MPTDERQIVFRMTALPSEVLAQNLNKFKDQVKAAYSEIADHQIAEARRASVGVIREDEKVSRRSSQTTQQRTAVGSGGGGSSPTGLNTTTHREVDQFNRNVHAANTELPKLVTEIKKATDKVSREVNSRPSAPQRTPSVNDPKLEDLKSQFSSLRNRAADLHRDVKEVKAAVSNPGLNAPALARNIAGQFGLDQNDPRAGRIASSLAGKTPEQIEELARKYGMLANKAKELSEIEEKASKTAAQAKRQYLNSVQAVTEGVSRLGRGIATLGLLSEENSEKLLKGFIKIQSVFDMVTGGIKVFTTLREAGRDYTRSRKEAEKAELAASLAAKVHNELSEQASLLMGREATQVRRLANEYGVLAKQKRAAGAHGSTGVAPASRGSLLSRKVYTSPHGRGVFAPKVSSSSRRTALASIGVSAGSMAAGNVMAGESPTSGMMSMGGVMAGEMALERMLLGGGATAGAGGASAAGGVGGAAAAAPVAALVAAVAATAAAANSLRETVRDVGEYGLGGGARPGSQNAAVGGFLASAGSMARNAQVGAGKFLIGSMASGLGVDAEDLKTSKEQGVSGIASTIESLMGFDTAIKAIRSDAVKAKEQLDKLFTEEQKRKGELLAEQSRLLREQDRKLVESQRRIMSIFSIPEESKKMREFDRRGRQLSSMRVDPGNRLVHSQKMFDLSLERSLFRQNNVSGEDQKSLDHARESSELVRRQLDDVNKELEIHKEINDKSAKSVQLAKEQRDLQMELSQALERQAQIESRILSTKVKAGRETRDLLEIEIEKQETILRVLQEQHEQKMRTLGLREDDGAVSFMRMEKSERETLLGTKKKFDEAMEKVEASGVGGKLASRLKSADEELEAAKAEEAEAMNALRSLKPQRGYKQKKQELGVRARKAYNRLQDAIEARDSIQGEVDATKNLHREEQDLVDRYMRKRDRGERLSRDEQETLRSIRGDRLGKAFNYLSDEERTLNGQKLPSERDLFARNAGALGMRAERESILQQAMQSGFFGEHGFGIDSLNTELGREANASRRNRNNGTAEAGEFKKQLEAKLSLVHTINHSNEVDVAEAARGIANEVMPKIEQQISDLKDKINEEMDSRIGELNRKISEARKNGA